ncbi:UPF0489 protein C5orf22-like [Harmonia axyridis]|uniref:UPF0489 protein C5orf22-like n=1 Tax=Harmonia axyridis TaxID=115357 RepID=UPI001E27765E|nr:UPF0489 protein C5orf22-like [Harmonia axyridis]
MENAGDIENNNENQGHNNPLIEIHQEQVEMIPEDDEPIELEEPLNIEAPEEAVAHVIDNVEPQVPENPHKDKNGHHIESIRHCKQIPVCIVNDNQDVMEFIHENISENFFPSHGSTLIHVDANPDLLIPKNMPAEECFNYRRLYLNHNFDRWILPNCFNNVFEKVIWLRPPWSNHIRNRSQTFEIGRHKDTGYLNVNCKEDFFIVECLFAPTSKLEDTKTVTLECVTVGNELAAANDDMEFLQKVVGDNHTIPTVLDIDLEFFMTRNPYLFIYDNTNAYGLLRNLFEYTPPASYADEDIVATVEKRAEDMKEIALLFLELSNNHKLPDLGYNPMSLIYYRTSLILEEFQRHNYQIAEIDWDMMYDCGHSFGVHDLPHQVSTHAELDVLFNVLEKFLDSLHEPPSIITVSRSDLENYAYIEARLLALLHSKFNCAVPLAFDQGNSVGVNDSVTESSEAAVEEEEEEDLNGQLIDDFLDFLTLGNAPNDNVDALNANLLVDDNQDEDSSDL